MKKELFEHKIAGLNKYTNISVMEPLPELNERIKKIIRAKTNGNVSKFVELVTKLTGQGVLSQQRLNRIFNIDTRTNKIPGVPSAIITTILKAFPEINKAWLLAGEGPMIVSEGNDDELKTVLAPGTLKVTLKEYVDLLKESKEKSDKYAEKIDNYAGLMQRIIEANLLNSPGPSRNNVVSESSKDEQIEIVDRDDDHPLDYMPKGKSRKREHSKKIETRR